MCREWCTARMATSLDDLRSSHFWRAVVAETLGTMFLTLVGCGSCVPWEAEYSPTIVQISLAFGISVATMVWCIGHVSGGHINPAVTAAMLITRKISLVKAVLYVLAQVVGAIVGAGVLKGLTPLEVRGPMGTTTPAASLSQGQAFGVEFLITFVLVLTVFSSVDSSRNDLGGSVPLTIGLSVTVCHLFAIKYTGSSMNPARSIGPAVVMNTWHEHWVYWCGPILGGIVAGLLYENIFAANASVSKAKGYLLGTSYDPEAYNKVEKSNESLKVTEAEASI